MNKFIIVGPHGIVANLTKILAAQGFETAEPTEIGGQYGMSYDLYLDPEPILQPLKPNDLDRTYGKKYRRSLRK